MSSLDIYIHIMELQKNSRKLYKDGLKLVKMPAVLGKVDKLIRSTPVLNWSLFPQL